MKWEYVVHTTHFTHNLHLWLRALHTLTWGWAERLWIWMSFFMQLSCISTLELKMKTCELQMWERRKKHNNTYTSTYKAEIPLRFGNMWWQPPVKSFMLYCSHISKIICTQISRVQDWLIQGCLKIMTNAGFQERKRSATFHSCNEYSRIPI